MSTPRILPNGAILVGDSIEIDGHASRPYHIVTHYHSDHIREISKSIREATLVIGTTITLEALVAMGYNIPFEKILYLDYNSPVTLEGYTITLHKCRHIPGSAQVQVTTYETTIGYTSDFKEPGKSTPILMTDILIIECTYGSPNQIRRYKHMIDEILLNEVEKHLREKPVVIYGYYGKLEEIAVFLDRHLSDIIFLAEDLVYKLLKVVKKYESIRAEVHKLYSTSGMKALERESNVIVLLHKNRFKSWIRGYHIILDGHLIEQPTKKLREDTIVVGWSDHGDFEDLVYYVDCARPSYLIVDASRPGHPYKFAEYIRSNYPSIRVYVEPQRKADKLVLQSSCTICRKT